MRTFFLAWVGWVLLASAAYAEEHRQAFDYSFFARIPILHEGRIKPLDSFARATLKHINGDASLPDASASQWLARVLFMPAEAMNEPVFPVRSALLAGALALPPESGPFYSFSRLAKAISSHQSAYAELAKKTAKEMTPQEQELVTLYNNVNDFAELLGSFSLLMPLADTDPLIFRDLGLPPAENATYLDWQRNRQRIENRQKDTLRTKKNHIKAYTPAELRIARLSAQLALLEAMDRNNAVLRVIPPFWEGSEEWLAPWAVIERSAGSPQSIALFKQWQALGRAYQDNDAPRWREASKTLLDAGEATPGVRSWALALEAFYNASGLLDKSLMLYGAGLLLAIMGTARRSRGFLKAAHGIIGLGALLQAVALVMRMAILMRPPVGTLYESMIFVSFIVVAAGLWLERRKQSGEVLMVTVVAAIVMLLAANVFGAGGDTLSVLVAVLNTNFWLATHVVCITTGYGAALVAGTLAHLYLFRRTAQATQASLMPLQSRMHGVALVALLFTSVGTMLGGIWADQSWGRFWGWDPKENGALLIVLWLIWLLHGRIAGQLGALGFAAGLAFINVVVALAWVGVNLLGVGLHSYGFTDAAADGLLAFCLCEMGFVAVTFVVIRKACSGMA